MIPNGQIANLIMDNLPSILLVMTTMIFLALVVFININIRFNKLNKRYKKLMRGSDGTNIEELLFKNINELRQAMVKVDSMATQSEKTTRNLAKCIQKLGVVRFNAFDDTGSDLSFAIAWLDGNNDGVVLSSIYGRNEGRTYAKPVSHGQSPYFLTDEEKMAIARAKGIQA